MARFILAETFTDRLGPRWGWIVDRLVEGESLEFVLVTKPDGTRCIEARQWMSASNTKKENRPKARATKKSEPSDRT